MTNVALTLSPVNRYRYDNVLEERYEFPSNYLSAARQAVGDIVVYYESINRGSRRTGLKGSGTYFAIACLDRLEQHPIKPNMTYAYLKDYQEFDKPVPLRA